MELDNIKLQTTWNDAAGSINNNFSKIKQAIAALVVEGGGLDEEELLNYLVQNGYINEITEEMLSEALGSEGNEGKYLVATEDGLGWEEVGTPDWNASEGEEGFIKNKTHGLSQKIGILSLNGDKISWYNNYGSDLYLEYSGKFIKLKDAEVGDRYQINGGPPTYIDVTSKRGLRIISLEDEWDYHSSRPISVFTSVDKLDEVYLPENLAKLDEDCVVAKGIVNQDDVYYYLPNNAPENDADHTLATEGYADLHPRYVEVENTEDIVFPEVEGTPKKMRLRFREGEIFVDSYEAISESAKLARLGRHSSRHTTPDDEEGVRVKKNGWRIYDHRTRKKGSSSYVLESIFLALHEERNGYKRYKVMFINKNNGQGMTCTPRNLMGCFGIVGDDYADVRKGHTKENFSEVNCFASQIYALVIDGVYLPFRLTAIREVDGMRYGGTPLNI